MGGAEPDPCAAARADEPGGGGAYAEEALVPHTSIYTFLHTHIPIRN